MSRKITQPTYKLKSTELSMQEIWQSTKGNVHKTKKQYTRKTKHKDKNIDK